MRPRTWARLSSRRSRPPMVIAAALGIVEAQEEPGHGRLAGAARAHDADPFAGTHREADAGVRGSPAAGIGEGHVLEGHAGVARLRPGRPVGHRRQRVEQGEDAARGRETQHPLVQERAQLAQRPEYLDAQHEDDQQRRQGHGAGVDAPGAERQRGGRTHGDAGVRDAARQRVRAEHPHRALEQGVRARFQPASAVTALAEGLQRGQSLQGVEKLGAERAISPVASEAGLAVPAMPQGRGQQRHQRRDQEHQRHGQVEERHEGEDQHRRERGDEELRQILTEVDLELLHALHQREHDLARAVADEVRGAEHRHVLV